MFNTKNIPKYIPSSCKVLFKIFNDSTNKQINITRICSRLMIDLNFNKDGMLHKKKVHWFIVPTLFLSKLLKYAS